MIHLHQVRKIYPPNQAALKNISLKVSSGEFLFVAGASGAGKSSLLRLLFCAERATEGEVVVAGRNLSSVPRGEIPYLRREIGVVFQDYKLLQRVSILDNVAFSLEVRGIKRSERVTIAESLLKLVGLGDRLDARPAMLSGGEQQRVAIARALVHRPKLLLADEPTGNLDPEMSRTIFDLLLEANSLGVTVVVATHNLGIIEDLKLRTIVLDRGKIIGDH